MSAGPSSVLAELAVHLQAVKQDPTTLLDAELLEKCELFTTTPEYRSQVWRETNGLFLQIADLLQHLQQDPSALIQFVRKLAVPYRFEDIKDLDFELGLDLESTPVHGLTLSLLEKATNSDIDAQWIANCPSIMNAIVRLWLCTADAGVATQAELLLTALLRASKNEPASVSGEVSLHEYGAGPIWRRMFRDRDIYSLLYHYTSPKTLSWSLGPVLSKRDKTIAQARLLHWLPTVGTMDWQTITTGRGLDVEEEVGLAEGQGLLHYATSKMVDTADDLLMHMTLLNFFSELIVTVRTRPHLAPHDSSLSLNFLKEQGIHKAIIDAHTSDTPGMEQSFLSPRTAQYISAYASTYPENFENSPQAQTVRNYLHSNIRKCEAHDLNILASMPRTTLIPQQSGTYLWNDCIILDLPITRTNPDTLKTLATIFHGPQREELTFPQAATLPASAPRTTTESSLARLLTFLYHRKHPTLFSTLLTHAETIAIKDTAVAALDLLSALITSNWSPTPPPPDLLPESHPLTAALASFPSSGLDLVLDPARSGSVLPALLKPATSYSNLVGGRGGAESAAFQVAMARFEVLKALGGRLERESGRADVLGMVRKRVAEGPWGVGGEAGSRIGTLDL